MNTPDFFVSSTENAFSAEILQNNFVFNKEDFTGKWEGEDNAITIDSATNKPKVVTTLKTIELDCDITGALTGTVSYRVLSGSGHDETGAAVAADTENVIGYVDILTGSFALVEYGDPLSTSETGTFRGILIENNFMKILQTQTFASDGVNNVNPLVSMMNLPKII
jgi:hypothetical protein